METVDLQVKIREKTGAAHPKRLRKTGFIPGVVYGHGTQAISLQVERGELEQALHTSAGENILLNLTFDDAKKNTTALIKAVQHDIVTDQITHIDFTVVSLTEKIEAKVHLHLKGESQGVAEGGILDLVHREVHVECLPTNIPDRIDVDVTALAIGDSLHAKDLVLPEGVVLLDESESVVAVVLAPQAEEPEAEVAIEGEEVAPAEPEVIAKGKKEEVEGEEAK